MRHLGNPEPIVIERGSAVGTEAGTAPALARLTARLSAELAGLTETAIRDELTAGLEDLAGLTGADRVCVGQVPAGEGAPPELLAWQRPELGEHPLQGQPIRLALAQWFVDVVGRSGPILVPSADQLPEAHARLRAALDSLGIGALLVVPIGSNGSTSGFLSLENAHGPRQWTEETVLSVRILADVIGAHLARARAEEELDRARAQLEESADRVAALTREVEELRAERARQQQAELERRTIDAEAAQEQRMEALGNLAGGVAHDFNNLLTVVICACEMLDASEALPEDARRHVQLMLDQGRRGSQLVRRILDFSRRSMIDARPSELTGLVEDACEELTRTIGKAVTLECRCAGAPLMVSADTGQIQQVVTNLVLNARDAMPEGGQVTVLVDRFELAPDAAPPVLKMKPGRWAHISVADHGVGIPEHLLDRVCEPFFTTKEVGKGTGLGLSQAYGIVSRHGGFLHIESQVGVGTTVHVFLPELAPAATAPRGLITDPSIPLGNGETVLIVEDEPGVRSVLAAYLSQLNYAPLTAANGREALETMRQHRGEVALVLSDVIMPIMSGVQLCEALREEAPDVPVLLMSGYSSDHLFRGDATRMAVDWLQKPVGAADMAQALAKALAARRSA